MRPSLTQTLPPVAPRQTEFEIPGLGQCITGEEKLNDDPHTVQ